MRAKLGNLAFVLFIGAAMFGSTVESLRAHDGHGEGEEEILANCNNGNQCDCCRVTLTPQGTLCPGNHDSVCPSDHHSCSHHSGTSCD